MSVEILQGDCLDILPTLAAGSFDAVVTDPPYGLEFMGKEWDKLAGDWNDGDPAKAGHPTGGLERWTIKRPRYHAGASMQDWHHAWAATVLRVLKPGGYMLAMGGTRTYHRLACAIEDAGFELRDCLMWIYGSGFPKGKGCLKPAYEPILLCRKPGVKVLPLGVDACRVPLSNYDVEEYIPNRIGWKDGIDYKQPMTGNGGQVYGDGDGYTAGFTEPNQVIKPAGRWPANVAHDGSDEVMEAFAAFGEREPGKPQNIYTDGRERTSLSGDLPNMTGWNQTPGYLDTGTAARFFYCAKASRSERGPDNSHPTVKPLALMRWLCKLVTPPGGSILDPFGGSGTTGKAAALEGFDATLIEREPAYVAIARRRIAEAENTLFTHI